MHCHSVVSSSLCWRWSWCLPPSCLVHLIYLSRWKEEEKNSTENCAELEKFKVPVPKYHHGLYWHSKLCRSVGDWADIGQTLIPIVWAWSTPNNNGSINVLFPQNSDGTFGIVFYSELWWWWFWVRWREGGESHFADILCGTFPVVLYGVLLSRTVCVVLSHSFCVCVVLSQSYCVSYFPNWSVYATFLGVEWQFKRWLSHIMQSKFRYISVMASCHCRPINVSSLLWYHRAPDLADPPDPVPLTPHVHLAAAGAAVGAAAVLPPALAHHPRRKRVSTVNCNNINSIMYQ